MKFLSKLVVLFLTFFIGTISSAEVKKAFTDAFYENSSGSPIFKLIQTAKKTIDIEIYEIEDLQVQSSILKALDRGVRVRIVQESEAVGSNCPVFDPIYARDTIDCKSQKVFVQNVRAKGGFYTPFNFQQFCSSSQYRCLEHGKIVLVDGVKALISTGNFNASNLCDPNGTSSALDTCNRDYTVLTTDPAALKILNAVFQFDFLGKAYDLSSLLNNQMVQKITVSPFSLDPLVQFIRSAKQSILVENQYLKNAEMNQELIAAAKRGVKVYLVVNSACSFGRLDPEKDSIAIQQWKTIFGAFDLAGIQSRAFTRKIKINGMNGYLHSKAIVVDGTKAWVGSVNGSTQAIMKNREFGIFLDQPSEVSKLVKFMIQDFNDPNTESWQEGLECKKDN